MLRRSVLQLSSRRSVAKMPVQITSQMPSYLLSRKAFSATSQQPEFQGPGSTEKQSASGSPLLKIFGGALLLGSVSFAAYHYGLIGNNYVREQHNASEPVSVGIGNKNLNEFPNSSQSSQDSKHLGVSVSEPMFQESKTSTPNLEHSEETIGTHADLTKVEDLNKGERESKFLGKDTSGLAQHDIKHIEEKDLLSSSQTNVTSDAASSTSSQSPEENHNMKNPEVKPDLVQHEAVEITPASMQDNPDSTENETKSTPMQHITTQDMPKDVQGDATGQTSSLLDEYYLRDIDQGTTTASSKKSKDLDEAIKDLNDGYISKDGKLVLDFLEAIHEAEKRQAGLDARTFAEEKRMMKEKYEKELKDARVKELMYAEREAILEKELNRERAKAAAALKSLQEKLEEKHKMELEEKENAAELKLEKKEELAKAELAAAIASEKASQIEKMAEANLHINALCMAFYARSEEARQSHSVHKLALGALALEDALSKGLPIQKEIDALHTYLEGIDKDSLLDLVLSSLPEEPRKHGTDNILQLNEKFDALKQTLRHFSLIPPGGGGILAHSLAHVASRLKVKEVDQSGDGIESLINRVESLLAQGKLSEAADTLEDGVKGSQAAEIVGDWVKRARYRAIAEQALTLLQSYATSISLT